MGGWFADVVVGYFITLFRIFARARRASRSKSWREVSATVAGANLQTESYAPRPIAEIVYTYRVDGAIYGGVDEKPFFSVSAARDYANQFSKGDAIVIRIKPGEPETSFIRDEDQSRATRRQNASDGRYSRSA